MWRKRLPLLLALAMAPALAAAPAQPAAGPRVVALTADVAEIVLAPRRSVSPTMKAICSA